MKERTHRLAALAAAALILVPAAAASNLAMNLPVLPVAHARGRLDLDIYASEKAPPRSPADAAGLPLHGWVPGDPRAERGEPTWVKHLSHTSHAGLGIAGLAASVAAGVVAPAIGFGIVLLVQSYREWREIRSPSSGT